MATNLTNLEVAAIHKLLDTKYLASVPSVICELMDSDACVLWKPSRSLTKSSDTKHTSNIGRLYPYSSNFEGRGALQHACISMDFVKDTTGRFYSENIPFTIENDFLAKDKGSASDKFMRNLDLGKLCAARFTMPDGAEGNFVVSVYRKLGSEDFSVDSARRLHLLAEFLPKLYQRLIASELKSAIIKVNEVLRPEYPEPEKAQLLLQKLCHELAFCFNFHEISIILQNSTSRKESYDLVASTLPLADFTKLSYRASEEDGLTGYILAKKRIIWFHDLHNFEHPGRRAQIEAMFPGIKWTDGAALSRLTKKIAGFPEFDSNLPFPFVGVPILGEGEKAIGVIRASCGINPFHFLDGQVEVFSLIAQEVGRWWNSILFVTEHRRRAQIWKALDNIITKQHDIFKGTENIDGLIAATVQSIVEHPGFSLAAFRQGENESNLKISAFSIGVPYHADQSDRSRFHKNNPLPLNGHFERGLEIGKNISLVPICRDATTIVTQGTREEAEAFHGMARLLSQPVCIKSKLFGVLDVGFKNEIDYFTGKERIEQFVELIAMQLALFARIAASVAEAEAFLKKEKDTFSVVTHQLRTPIFTAHQWLKNLNAIPTNLWSENATRKLLETTGMVGKAKRVTETIDAIGHIATGGSVKVQCQFVKANEARKLVIEVARNALSDCEEEMKCSFKVEPLDWGTGRFLWKDHIAGQCLDAVISNAFKYSGIGEMVLITIAEVEVHFIIRVINIGPYSIRAEDVENCKRKEWRGHQAHDQQGRGIGLWITDEWMKAQGGELKVYPTSKLGETQIELRFLRKLEKSI